jgi:hypothetical protein
MSYQQINLVRVGESSYKAAVYGRPVSSKGQIFGSARSALEWALTQLRPAVAVHIRLDGVQPGKLTEGMTLSGHIIELLDVVPASESWWLSKRFNKRVVNKPAQQDTSTLPRVGVRLDVVNRRCTVTLSAVQADGSVVHKLLAPCLGASNLDAARNGAAAALKALNKPAQVGFMVRADLLAQVSKCKGRTVQGHQLVGAIAIK